VASDDPFDTDKLRAAEAELKRILAGKAAAPSSPKTPSLPPKHQRGERFLKGPVPLDWLGAAAQLPGKATAVGVYLWFLTGVKNAAVVTLSLRQSPFGLEKQAVRRAINQLEKAHLIKVKRGPGRPLTITICKAKRKKG
jgi:hypothetical protein